MVAPYYSDEQVVIYCGDCREILPSLPKVDLVLTDPPYGGNYDTDYTRFTGGLSPNCNWGNGIIGDDQIFDPAPWLSYPDVCIWGYQHFAQRVPLGTILVWNKKRDSQLGTFLSDGELAWENRGMGVYVYPYVWHGFDRQGERGGVLHPTQKPTALMVWCLGRFPEAKLTLDPFLGSGTTLVAAKDLGRKAIGIEIEEKYCEIAAKRCEAWQPSVWDTPVKKEKVEQEGLW